MPIDERWNDLSDSDWDAFAFAWMQKIRAGSSEGGADVGQSVVMMSFTARAEHQWRFINAALRHAESDEELAHIAAGPVEHLLSKHGDDYIVLVEQRSASEPKFARMMVGVWRHMMSDDIWQRAGD